MIFDMRFRPPYRGFLKLHVFARDPWDRRPGQMGVDPPPSLIKRSLPLALEELDRAGITKALVVGRRAYPPFGGVSNEDVMSFVSEYPDRFYAAPALDPLDRNAALEEVARLKDTPAVKAVHIEPGWCTRPMYADAAHLYPIYEQLVKAGLPLLISAGGTIGPDFSYVDPVRIQRVAKDFPQLRIILAHGGWPYVTQALAVAFDCVNVYLSPDMYLNVPNMPGSLEYVRAANYYLQERLLFGTAYPARPLVESVRQFDELPFAAGVKERVLYSNAVRALGIG